MMANAMAMAHSMAGDEILKNTFANNAFENFENAAYKSLLALCGQAGVDSARAPLETSLKEEEHMAAWVVERREDHAGVCEPRGKKGSLTRRWTAGKINRRFTMRKLFPTGARGSITTGTAGNRAGGTSSGRIDGTVTFGPSMPGDAEIRAEDPKVDQKIKSICKGC